MLTLLFSSDSRFHEFCISIMDYSSGRWTTSEKGTFIEVRRFALYLGKIEVYKQICCLLNLILHTRLSRRIVSVKGMFSFYAFLESFGHIICLPCQYFPRVSLNECDTAGIPERVLRLNIKHVMPGCFVLAHTVQ